MEFLDRISAFLYYGYVPEFKDTHISEVFPDIEMPGEIGGVDLGSKNESEIIDLGVIALKTAFTTCLENNPSEMHVLPLSGGMDSRAILANLLELGVKERLTTVTFGVPGAWDYEIARDLTNRFDIAHTPIDLTEIQVTTEKLYQTARNGSAWTFMFDGFYNNLIPQKFGSDAVYWSGFMGDFLGGQSLRPQILDGFNSWEDAVLYYAGRMKTAFFDIIDLYPPGFNPTSILPTAPFLKESQMNYFDQLGIFDTHMNYLQRTIISAEYRYVKPFCNKAWVNFILLVPLHLRMKKYTYKNILFSAFPDLFSCAIKECWGGSLKSSSAELFIRHALQWIKIRTEFADPFWNRVGIYRPLQYIDFDDAIRQRIDYKDLVRENIADLKKRNLIDWLDLDYLWADHQNKKRDLGDELLLLTALEISLKVDDERDYK